MIHFEVYIFKLMKKYTNDYVFELITNRHFQNTMNVALFDTTTLYIRGRGRGRTWVSGRVGQNRMIRNCSLRSRKLSYRMRNHKQI